MSYWTKFKEDFKKGFNAERDRRAAYESSITQPNVLAPFEGTYVKWDGVDSLSLSSKDQPTLALKEVKLFRKVARAAKKTINEEMRILRMNQRVEKASWGPLGRGGGKVGMFIRAVQTDSRHAGRIQHEKAKLPIEIKKQMIEKILIGLDQFEVKLEQERLTA
jgi:hypothetical protein